MKRILLMILVIGLVFTGCQGAKDADGNKTPQVDENKGNKESVDLAEVAKNYAQDFFSKNTDKLINNYTYSKDMLAVVNESFFNSVYADVKSKFGEYETSEYSSTTEHDVYIIYTYYAGYSSGAFNLNIVFDKENNIAGLNYKFAVKKESSESKYEEMEVSFGSDEFPISGTLTIPDKEGPQTVVILVHGSGPNDRNETIYGNQPFYDIAQGLAAKGIATLRYDKRTFTYGTKMDPNTITVQNEVIEDVAHAFNYLQLQSAVQIDEVYILGHSLGGYLMPMIAKEVNLADGYIVMAGSVTPMEDLIVYQYNYILGLDGLDDGEKEIIKQVEQGRDNIKALTAESNLSAVELMGLPKSYWLSIKDYNPVEAAQSIEKPMLILQGERDYQVPVTEFEQWKNKYEDNANYTFKLYDGLTHLMIYGEGDPTPQEYETAGKVDQRVIDDIADFVTK